MDLSLANVYTASVQSGQQGVGKKSPNNILILTREDPAPSFDPDGLGYKIYLESTEGATDFGTDSVTYAMLNAGFAQKPNILAAGGYCVVIPFFDDNESVEAALARIDGLVQWFAGMCAEVSLPGDILGSAAVIQAAPGKMFFWPFTATADWAPGGIADQLRTGGFDKNRAIGRRDDVEINVLTQMASYAFRALSVDFTGENTTMTMHLKDATTIQPDPNIDQTQLLAAKAAGVDVYVSLAGVPKWFTSVANTAFDRVYNREAFLQDILTAGFNTLATTDTKLGQTEEDIGKMKDKQEDVCLQYRRNKFLAPGEWTATDTFGNQADFLRNIREQGFYIYSTPLALQSPSDRLARKAPAIRIALKEAGAVHSGNTIININP